MSGFFAWLYALFYSYDYDRNRMNKNAENMGAQIAIAARTNSIAAMKATIRVVLHWRELRDVVNFNSCMTNLRTQLDNARADDFVRAVCRQLNQGVHVNAAINNDTDFVELFRACCLIQNQLHSMMKDGRRVSGAVDIVNGVLNGIGNLVVSNFFYAAQLVPDGQERATVASVEAYLNGDSRALRVVFFKTDEIRTGFGGLFRNSLNYADHVAVQIGKQLIHFVPVLIRTSSGAAPADDDADTQAVLSSICSALKLPSGVSSLSAIVGTPFVSPHTMIAVVDISPATNSTVLVADVTMALKFGTVCMAQAKPHYDTFYNSRDFAIALFEAFAEDRRELVEGMLVHPRQQSDIGAFMRSNMANTVLKYPDQFHELYIHAAQNSVAKPPLPPAIVPPPGAVRDNWLTQLRSVDTANAAYATRINDSNDPLKRTFCDKFVWCKAQVRASQENCASRLEAYRDAHGNAVFVLSHVDVFGGDRGTT